MPEKDQRQREWVTASESANRVDQAGLSAIIRQLDISPLDAKDYAMPTVSIVCGSL